MAPTLEVADLHPEIEHLEVKIATPSLPTQTLKSANSAYVIQEEPIRTRRPLRVACMGAGYSGLMMAIVVSQKLQDSNLEFVVYERNKDLGGTWLENR
jgi:hypothetical protein